MLLIPAGFSLSHGFRGPVVFFMHLNTLWQTVVVLEQVGFDERTSEIGLINLSGGGFHYECQPKKYLPLRNVHFIIGGFMDSFAM